MFKRILAAAAVVALLTLAAIEAPPLFAFALVALGFGLTLWTVSASRGGAKMPARRLPHWIDVAVYRGLLAVKGMRDYTGRLLDTFQHRIGAVCYAFPGTVTADMAFGVIGEIWSDGPTRTQPARINHGTAADIVVGRWFTLNAAGEALPGGTGAIGGVLCAPKTLASYGTAAGGPLAPTLTVPTGTLAEFLYMGQIVVAAPAAVAIGAAAKYNTTTGVIGVGAPAGGEAAIPNSRFIRYPNAAPGLALLELTN